MDNQNSTTTASVLITEAAFQGIGEIAADIISQIGLIWEQILRTRLIVPFLKLCVWVCLTMSVMLFIERVYMGIVIVFVKIFRGRPEKRYKWESIKDARYRPTKVFPARVFGFISEYKFQRSQGGTNFFQDDEFKFQRPQGGTNFFQDDIELGNSNYPMVLVQIPMYNEKEVYQFSIGAACDLSWPTDRIIIQVLDDSTDPAIKAAVESEVRKWKSKGINIKYEIRDNRNGYKAGALKQGMKNSYVQQCDYVAIFDADFQPEPNFLRRTIPFFIHNPEVGLVQARWKFVNANECLMTRFQEMSLDYHFIVEQEVGFSTYAFFGFNGTAGVWRIAALNEAGGWKDRTTVEDMDLAVRASLKGWKFVFVGDLQVKSELPSTFKALRYQQHRWSCGPANLFRKMAMEIITNEKVTLWKKVHVIYSFFLVRKIIAHIISFVFYCVVIPATVFFPEVHIPKWGLVYIPTTITIMNAVCTPKSLYLVVFWVTFENVMAMHRTKGLFIGLFEYGRVNEWVVTEKLGDTLIKSKAGAAKILEKPRSRIGERFHLLELIMGAYLLVCGCYDVAFGKNYYFFYLYAQSIAFFVTGFGHIGTFVPNS